MSGDGSHPDIVGPAVLRPPAQRGFLDPQSALQLVSSAERLLGTRLACEIHQHAGGFRLPAPDEPVREDKVRRLHAALREIDPGDARIVLRDAGEHVGRIVVQHRMTARARRLLQSAPWPLAAWLISQQFKQTSWTFVGSGTLIVRTPMELEIAANPLAPPGHAHDPQCTYHTGLLRTIYSQVIDARLDCREVTCRAAGDTACSFAIGVNDPA